DADRRWVWILSDVGLGHYDDATEDFVELPAPTASVGVDFGELAKAGASVAPASDGGVFLGTAHGLVYANGGGEWRRTPIRASVRTMVTDRDGWLWVATKTGLVARKPNGDILKIGAAQGCAVVDPRLIVELPTDLVLVIGGDEGGHERLAFGKQLAWTSYR